MQVDLEVNIEEIKNAIQRATIASGRSLDEVTLVAASKTVAIQGLQAAIDLGLRVFGENRVQEALLKWPQLLETGLSEFLCLGLMKPVRQDGLGFRF